MRASKPNEGSENAGGMNFPLEGNKNFSNLGDAPAGPAKNGEEGQDPILGVSDVRFNRSLLLVLHLVFRWPLPDNPSLELKRRLVNPIPLEWWYFLFQIQASAVTSMTVIMLTGDVFHPTNLSAPVPTGNN